MINKLTPIEEPFPPTIAAILSQYPQQNGYILKLFRAFANSERFLIKGVPNLLDDESPLDIRIREIVILRVTAKKNCEYEWGVHASIFANAAMLSTDQIRATREESSDAQCWSQEEQLLINAIDELLGDGKLSADVHKEFNARWTAEQQLEILALCGTYQTVSFVANVAEVSSEEFGKKFPV